jgi:hypothetical protein
MLRTSDLLTVAEQSCGSRFDLELSDRAGSSSERCSQKVHNVRFSGPNIYQDTYGCRTVEAKHS